MARTPKEKADSMIALRIPQALRDRLESIRFAQPITPSLSAVVIAALKQFADQHDFE